MESASVLSIFTALFATVIAGFVYVCFWARSKKASSQSVDGASRAEDEVSISSKDSEKITDPVEYCNHIQSEIKKTKQKAALKQIESGMTREQMEEERMIQRKQLEDIFKLMAEQKDEFGVNSVDDIQDQMKLYV